MLVISPAGDGHLLAGQGRCKLYRPLQRYAVVKAMNIIRPVNVEIRQMAAGEQCSPIPL